LQWLLESFGLATKIAEPNQKQTVERKMFTETKRKNEKQSIENNQIGGVTKSYAKN